MWLYWKILKFLSIKCLFPLIEELKKSKFENQINKIIHLSSNESERNEFTKNLNIQKILNDKLDEEWNNILIANKKDRYFEFLNTIFTFSFDCLILEKQKISKIQLIEGFFENQKNIYSKIKHFGQKEELIKLLNDLLAFNYPLQYSKEIHNLFIAAFNFIIFSFDKLEGFNEKEMNIIYYNLYHLYPVYLEIKNIIKDKKPLNLETIITKLAKFFIEPY